MFRKTRQWQISVFEWIRQSTHQQTNVLRRLSAETKTDPAVYWYHYLLSIVP